MGLDFSQVTHPQLDEEGEAQAGNPKKESAHSLAFFHLPCL